MAVPGPKRKSWSKVPVSARTVQVLHCARCLYKFTDAPGRNRTYPLNKILQAVSDYHLGHSLTHTQTRFTNRWRLQVTSRTIASWLKAYRSLTGYAGLRNAGRELFAPGNIIRGRTLRHQQVYRFQIHQAKLHLTLRGAGYPIPAQLARYLDTITSDYPHHLFTTTKHRASRLKTRFNPPIPQQSDDVTQLAKLVLPTSPSNKKRHETLQRFMLINDASTVAVEVPVYLTPQDISYFKAQSLTFNLPSSFVTGHIDFLQVRNGTVYILDYKPDAKKQRHASTQLMIYALALSRRTGIPLQNIICLWFDDQNSFQFSLHHIISSRITDAPTGGDIGPVPAAGDVRPNDQ